jgi:competence protein ComEA
MATLERSSAQCLSTRRIRMARRLVSLVLVVTLALLVSRVTAPASPVGGIERITVVADVGADHDKVNINTATARQLQKLEGVGHTVAERIVQYRETHGPFKRGEDLRKVEGIGAALWEKNRERIVVK